MGNIIHQLINLIAFGVRIYTFIIIARAIISWVQPNPYNPIVQLLYKLTEPVLFPIRRSLAKYMGGVGIDFSPIVVILLLHILMRLVAWVLLPLA